VVVVVVVVVCSLRLETLSTTLASWSVDLGIVANAVAPRFDEGWSVVARRGRCGF
jgi:hypothetical protein